MSFDFSAFTLAQRHIAHQAGRADGDAQRDADWIQVVLDLLGSSFGGLNQYPMTRYAPDGSGNVTDANFIATFNAAVTACQSGGGGRVVIPAGTWNLTEQLLVQGVTIDGQPTMIFIEGAGASSTALKFPDGYTGNGLYLQGSPPSAHSLHWGGVLNLTIEAAGSTASGHGLVIDACVGVVFDNLRIFNFAAAGGAGVYCRDFQGGGFNSQDLLFSACDISNNYINMDVQQFQATLIDVKVAAGISRAMKMDACLVSMYGGNVQGDPPVVVEVSGAGGNRLVFEGQYWEGATTPTIFQLGEPSVTSNYCVINNFINNGSPAIFCDVQGNGNSVAINNTARGDLATCFLKARNVTNPAISLTVTNPGDSPANFNNTKFNLDAVSAAKFYYQNCGVVRQGSDLFVSGTYNLPGYAQGSEPTAIDQALIFNTTTNLLRFRANGTWNDIAVSGTDITLYDILAPYAVEIWDVGVARSLQSLTTPTTWTGLKNGTVLSNGLGGHPPDVAASQRFRGQYGATGTYDAGATTSKFWTGTLSTPVANGKWPGVFVVFAPSTTSTAANQRQPIELRNTVPETFVVNFDDSSSSANHVLARFKTGGISIAGVVTTTIRPHVFYAGFDSGTTTMFAQLDAATAVSSSNSAAATAAMSTIFIGGQNADNTGGDLTILFLAVLDSKPPSALITLAQKIAKQTYGIG